MNWVERKAQREQCLRDKGGELWEETRAAFEDACVSYRKFYRRRAEFTPENGHRFRISVAVDGISRRLRASGDSEAVTITFVKDDEGPRVFRMDSDGTRAFILDADGKQITPDELSERMLLPLFFPGAQQVMTPFNYRAGQTEDASDE